MDKYPLVRQFLEAKPFGPDHAAHDLSLCHPIVPALEYFLSLRNVKGHDAKLKQLNKIGRQLVKNARKNDAGVQWDALCAEIYGVYLLGKTLGLEILGLEEVSPRTLRPNADCDIVAAVNGEATFFEVKRNSAEGKQAPPGLLEEGLRELESRLAFSMTVQLFDQNYDCSDLNGKLKQIENHVVAFERNRRLGGLLGQNAPISFEDSTLRVVFHSRREGRIGCHYVSPRWSPELSKYLLGPGDIGADGTPMIPKVQEAIEKGADYLMCCAPNWKGWPEIVEGCFQYSIWTEGVTYFADDLRFGTLSGIVLFACHDDFCIVNSLRSRATNRLRA